MTVSHWVGSFAPADGDPLAEARRSALADFEACGFPSRKDERWKHTSVTRLASLPLRVAPPAGGTADVELPEGHGRVVLVDGHLVAHDLPDGVEVLPLQALSACTEDRPFVALNAAFFQAGVVLVARRSVAVPVHLVSVLTMASAGHMVAPRVVVRVEGRGDLTLVEHHVGDRAGSFTNAVVEVELVDGGRLRHVKLLREGPNAYHVAHISAELGRNTWYALHSFSLGGRLARTSVDVRLVGAGAEVELTGLSLGTDEQQVDHTLLVEHIAPHCRSRQVFKGVLDGRSRGVFNGLVRVAPGAAATDARQQNPNLLLSDDAVVHTRPQLLIDHDDVSAAHGASVGRLDEDTRFYLQSRGLSAEAAGRLLVRAFVSEVVDELPEGWLRDTVRGYVDAWLGGAA